MKLTTSEKINIIMKRQNMSMTELAKKTDQSRQNLSNKMSRDNFSENDLRLIANALECDLRIQFVDRETGEPII